MTTDTNKISENIASQRGYAKLTKKEAAKQLNVTQQTYIRWEKDPASVPLTTLAEIANCFGCKLASFFKD